MIYHRCIIQHAYCCNICCCRPAVMQLPVTTALACRPVKPKQFWHGKRFFETDSNRVGPIKWPSSGRPLGFSGRNFYLFSSSKCWAYYYGHGWITILFWWLNIEHVVFINRLCPRDTRINLNARVFYFYLFIKIFVSSERDFNKQTLQYYKIRLFVPVLIIHRLLYRI